MEAIWNVPNDCNSIKSYILNASSRSSRFSRMLSRLAKNLLNVDESIISVKEKKKNN